MAGKAGRPRGCRSYSSLGEKLISKVNVTEPGCWTWTGAMDGGGYGSVYWRGRNVAAHRASHECFVGPIGDGLDVMHSCDNPPCINPAHLSSGTRAENLADMVRRGRSATGSRNGVATHPERVRRGDGHWKRIMTGSLRRDTSSPAAKLTARNVYEIRRMRTAGVGAPAIGLRFNVSSTTVYRICNGEVWGHV